MTRALASGSLAFGLLSFVLVSGCASLVGADFDRPGLDGGGSSPREADGQVESGPHVEDAGPTEDGAVRCPPGACCPGCADGQRCVSGQCVCDVSSCQGCCRNNQCLGGKATGACGERGASCETCGADQACNSKCITVTAGCFNFTSSFESSCDDICTRGVGGGAYCSATMCNYRGTPVGGGLLFFGDNCDDPTKGTPALSCGSTFSGSPGKRAMCCCARP